MFDIGSSEGEIRSRKENKSRILNSPRRLNEIMENGLVAYFEPTCGSNSSSGNATLISRRANTTGMTSFEIAAS